jgi:hypothetical protein
VDFSLAFWQKIAAVTITLGALGFVIAMFLNARLTDVIFMEGALIFAMGAYVAAGPKPVDKRSTIAVPSVSRDYLLEQQPHRVSTGLIIMAIGAALIAVGIVIGLL